jgi:23S rRNA (pseudouridine1915-N3)-methyltransferase
MYIKLINLGKTTLSYLREGEKEYEKRLKHYVKFERIDLKEIKARKQESVKEIKKKEANQVLSQVKDNDVLVLLDEKGTQYTSSEFAKWIGKKQLSGKKNWVFLIGGAYGFDESIYARSNEKVSLSKMTFSHQMIRLLFLEQLYRAHTILNSEKYHHF